MLAVVEYPTELIRQFTNRIDNSWGGSCPSGSRILFFFSIYLISTPLSSSHLCAVGNTPANTGQVYQAYKCGLFSELWHIYANIPCIPIHVDTTHTHTQTHTHTVGTHMNRNTHIDTDCIISPSAPRVLVSVRTRWLLQVWANTVTPCGDRWTQLKTKGWIHTGFY